MDSCSSFPAVSCLMPTRDRRSFVPRALRQFLEQDYANSELVVVDDGDDPIADLLPLELRIRYFRLDRPLILGTKRNLTAERARGEILVHWDDDDWMAPWRLSYQVKQLRESGAEACGLARLYYHDPQAGRAWEYVYSGARPWVAGNTLCYLRSFWAKHPFAALQVGEDNDFLWRHQPRLLVHDDTNFFVGTVHGKNTSPKRTSGGSWRPWPLHQLPNREQLGALGMELQVSRRPAALPAFSPQTRPPGVGRRGPVTRRVRS